MTAKRINHDTVLGVVHSCLERGWYTIPQLNREISRRLDKQVLDTTISSKIRELRKPPFNFTVIKQLITTTTIWQYKIKFFEFEVDPGLNKRKVRKLGLKGL